MTRDEAYKILDKMPLCTECDSSIFPYSCYECETAFLMAMGSLKQPDIIRCKDCKHGIGDENAFVCGYKIFTAGPDWYCADAERREEEE